MNRNNLMNLILPAVLVPAAVIVIINLLSGGGNQLGNTFGFLLLIGGAIGFFAPRAGLVIFICFQFYADFFKRLLVLGDALSMQDVMISLGMGPIIVVAACVASAIRCLTGKVPFLNVRDISFFMGCVTISVVGAFTQTSLSSGITAIGQSMLGTSMLGMSAYSFYVLFRTREQVRTVLKVMAISAVPMALYTFHQVIFGVSRWEENYILTGLSPVLFEFYLLDGFKDMRPFSTLNTHTSLGAVSGTLSMICLLIMRKEKQLFNAGHNRWIAYTLLGMVYLAACIVCRNRTTYLIPLLVPVLVWIFSGGIRTLCFYIFSVLSFVWLVTNSEWLNSQILVWTGDLESTSLGKKMGSIGTFQDRIKSFMALNRAENWSPFGLPPNMRPFTHDQISELVVKLGYVPMGIAFLGQTIFLVWWHRNCLKIKDPADRKLLITLDAIIITLLICSVAYGNMMFVAPVNSVLGMLIGISMSVFVRNKELQKNPLAAAAYNPSPNPPAPIPSHLGTPGYR